MDGSEITIQLQNWHIRMRLPAGLGPFPVLLLLHGWTGDENSMRIFTPRLPKNYLLLAPRALYRASLGGNSWHAHDRKTWPSVQDFEPAVNALVSLLTPGNFPAADFSQLNLLGFSQGAALALTFTLLHPERVMSVAGLAGFLPDGAEVLAKDHRLIGLPVFIAHGSQDEIVPVEKARHCIKQLEQAGSQVLYCEDNVGHKLSADCFKGLDHFFLNR